MKNYLDFEKDIKTLEQEMENLKSPGSDGISEVDTNQIKTTQDQIDTKLKNIYSNLNSGKLMPDMKTDQEQIIY